jgi:peroxiredoxin
MQAEFEALNIEIVGVSRDLAPSQNVFAQQVGATNQFISDPSMRVINMYGAGGEGGNALSRRYYFLIDPDGVLVWKNVNNQLIPVEALLGQLAEVVE